ncbi:MAG: hypothetical protein KKD94_05530 [Nanoarchaeota archaeon]|nr:hypothetical protein [Nanoarchaeota archaeon]MBU1988910.1 hypothetical protein [Nanoarchaeota archaeon]
MIKKRYFKCPNCERIHEVLLKENEEFIPNDDVQEIEQSRTGENEIK